MDAGPAAQHIEEPTRQTGRQIHRRDSILQILLPFAGAVLLIVVMFLLVGIQNDPIWRTHAQGIADFVYSVLCLLPIAACLFPLYVLVLLGVYGLAVLHKGAAGPLEKLEKRASDAADWLDAHSNTLRQKTVSVTEQMTPVMNMMDIFDQPDQAASKENGLHESDK